jgi:hypothetical protein
VIVAHAILWILNPHVLHMLSQVILFQPIYAYDLHHWLFLHIFWNHLHDNNICDFRWFLNNHMQIAIFKKNSIIYSFTYYMFLFKWSNNVQPPTQVPSNALPIMVKMKFLIAQFIFPPSNVYLIHYWWHSIGFVNNLLSM